jgi:hypothetical protein
MPGTDSTFVGMPGFNQSNPNVGYGVNRQHADRGNANGNVVDNTQAANALSNSGLRTDPGQARGAYLNSVSKPGALYPHS